MKNKEKYREKIIEIAMDGDAIALTKDGMITSCWETECRKCIFHDNWPCKFTRKQWLEQEIEILDEVEKEYLRSVIKPFKEHVAYIRKSSLGTNTQYISIVYVEISDFFPSGYRCEIKLPCFANDTMYKGMEIGHKYSVKELGL